MRSLPRRFGNLFGRRSSVKTSRRRNPKRGMGRGFESSRFSRVESLESRAMLAVDLDFDFNVSITDSSTLTPAPTPTERSTTVGVSVNGITGLNVGFNALNDSVYVHQAFDSQNVQSFSLDRASLAGAGFNTSAATGGGRNAYSFYTSDSLEVGTRVAVFGDLSGNGDVGVEDLILHLEAAFPRLAAQDANGVRIVRGYDIQGFNFDDSSNGFMTIASNAKIEFTTITGSKQTLATGATTISGTTTQTLWDFDIIRASAGGTAEDVGFYFAAGGVTVSKPTFVDLSGSAGDSTFFVGTPLAVTTGGLSVDAAIQDFNANVAVSGEVVLETTGDGSGDASRGIFVRRNLFAGAVGVGNVSVIANGADFRMEAGSKIGAAGGAQLNTFNLDLTDASAQIAGTIKADTHQYILRGTNLGLNSLARSITTLDPSTGLHRGSLEGDEMFVTLNNAVDKTVDADAEDGSLDIRAAVDTLRVATGLDVALNYEISVSNLDDLTVDAVMATEGDISLESRQGTLSLDAVIDTFGGVTLTSFDDLDIDTQLSTAQGGLTLISNGDVNINAAISTADTVAGLVTVIAGDETAPASASSITVTSLVAAAVEVSLTATGSVLTVDPADAGSDPSLLRAPTAVIVAGSVINVGLNIEETITASSGGAMTIRDYGDEWVGGAQQPALELLDLESTDGTITVESVRSILATSVVAGGAGDISLTTTEGDIELVDIAAVGNRVTLVAEGFDDEDDVDGDAATLHLGGTITLVDPAAIPVINEIDWTAHVSPDTDLYRNAPIISATLLGPGDIDFVADASVELRNIWTREGAITVSAGGSITATSVMSVGEFDITLDATGGDLSLWRVVTEGGLQFLASGSIINAPPLAFGSHQGETPFASSSATTPSGYPLESNPDGSWLHSSGPAPSQAPTWFATTLNEVTGVLLHGYVKDNHPTVEGWFGQPQPRSPYWYVFETYVSSDITQVIEYVHGGNDGHSLFVDGKFDSGGGFGVDVSGSLSLVAGVPIKLTLVSHNSMGDPHIGFSIGGLSIDNVPGIRVSALPFIAPLLESTSGTAELRGAFVTVTAGGTAGMASSPLVLDVDDVSVLDADEVFLELERSATFSASVEQRVHVTAIAPGCVLTIGSIELAGTEAEVFCESVGDLEISGDIVGGANQSIASVSLVAGRSLDLTAGIDITTDVLNLSMGRAPDGVDLSEFDNVGEYAVEYTGSGNLGLTFDRDTDVKLARAFAQSGSVTVENLGAGQILVGYGGITAGALSDEYSITVDAAAGIGSYGTAAEDVFAGIGGGGFTGSGGLSVNSVRPSTLPSSRTVKTVSWQGQSVAAREDRWVVLAEDTVSPAGLMLGLAGSSQTVSWQVSPLGEGYYALHAPGASENDVLGWVATTAGVLGVQPDIVVQSQRLPNDPLYGNLWGLENTGQSGGRVDADIDAEAAWEVTIGSPDVVIGVIDSGVDYSHPDLADNMWRNPGEIAGDGVDNDGNGFIDDVFGWDFFDNDADPMDTDGHGTHVAGTIAAQGDNGIGVVGVAWEASIMALRFLGPFGGFTSDAIAAVNYATMMKRDFAVNVVATNNSWGGGGYNQSLADAITAGAEAGILFVAAAGNAANDNDAALRYPASYPHSAIISVAATDRSNNLAGFSNYGQTTVDIGAPGVEIYSTLPANRYGNLSGTSMAAPHVSGVAALLAAAYPNATAAQIRAAILGSAVQTPSLTGRVLTGGLLNAANALAWMNTGTVAAGGQVRLITNGDVDLATAAGRLVIEATGRRVRLAQAGDTKIAADGIDAGMIELSIAGSLLDGGGVVRGEMFSISATNGITAATDVDTISAVSVAGDIEITEEDGLTLGAGGINAGTNDVSLVLTTGDLTGASQTITGNLVSVELEDSGVIDILTNAAVLSAVTFDGDVTIENAGGFSIGEDGIIAGDGGVDDVVLVATTGAITAGVGVIEAAGLTIEAAGAISVETEVDTVVAANELGDITISNSDRDLEVTDIQTTSGAVTVLNDDGDVAVALIVARGLAGDVTIVTTGLGVASADAAAVTLETSSIDARRDVVITSAGGITGDADPFSADVVAGSVALVANGGDLTASVETDVLSAQTLGVGNNLDVTQIGTRPVFLGTGANATVLSSTGDLTFTSSRPDDADPAANDIIVTELPEFGGGATLSLNTDADLIYAVTTSSLTASGSLNEAMENASTHGNDGAGETRVAFSNQIRSSVVLTETIEVAGTMVLDGTLRINLQTGGYTIGRPVDIDGSRMRDGSLYAFNIVAGGDDSVLSGMAFYGFNEDGGAAINIDGADDVVIANNSFGITSAGRASRNANGIIIANSTGSEITGNVIVLSSDVGIQVDSGVDTLTISGNSIGTNLTRRNYRNAIGILVNGSWDDGADPADPSDDTFSVDGVDITDNFIAFNSDAGIVVRGATAVDVEGNTVTLNGTGIMIGDVSVGSGSSLSDTIALYGNEVTRNSGNGIEVTEGSRDVTIGGTGVDEANFIGTNARGSRGLGNRANGVLIDGAGSGVSLAGNTILGNGTRRSDSDQNGVKVVGQDEEVEIEDNQIGENRGDGILADGATTEATIVRNSIFANYGSGVRAVDTAFASLVIGALNPTGVGNVLSSNRRFGIDLSGGEATVGGNSMLGNRRGGIDSGVVAPVATGATLDGDDLTVTLDSALAADDVVHVYLGTGRSTSSQGLTYLGRFVATGGETSFEIENLDPALRVRVGSSITVTLTESDGAGTATASTSEFSRNVSVRRA